jgi:hypothetical protein
MALCAGCDLEYTELKGCAGCLETLYCSPECQGIDWAEHGKVCKIIAHKVFCGMNLEDDSVPLEVNQVD